MGMTGEEAIRILKYNSNVIHKTIHGETDPNEVEALDMAIEALKTINDIYSGFEELINQIEQEDDTANAQERIDEWCNNKLRSIIANHYLNRMVKILKCGDLACQ